MNVALILLVLAVLMSIGAGAFFLVKKQKARPLTPASIPPIPSPQEANLHFTPVHAPVVAPKKPGINKKVLIGIAVLFNVILIGGILTFVGQNVIKKKPAPIARTAPSPTKSVPKPTLPTSNQLRIPTTTVVSPSPELVSSDSSSLTDPSTAVSPQISPTVAIASITATLVPTKTTTPSPSPTEIIIAMTSPTPSPTQALAVATLPETGNPLSYIFLVIPALLVAFAFIF